MAWNADASLHPSLSSHSLAPSPGPAPRQSTAAAARTPVPSWPPTPAAIAGQGRVGASRPVVGRAAGSRWLEQQCRAAHCPAAVTGREGRWCG